MVTIDGRRADCTSRPCPGIGRARAPDFSCRRNKRPFAAVVGHRRRHSFSAHRRRRADSSARQAASSSNVTTSTQTAVDGQASRWHPEDGAHPAYSLIARWVLISVLTGIAFHRSFYSIGLTAHRGGLGGFAWTVPTVAILVAIGVSRRHRTELPIHDRQIDIIVGTMGLGLALLI